MAPRLLTADLLDELEALLRDRGARVADSWSPPLAAEVVANQVAELGVAVPVELGTWWGRHNGVANVFRARTIGLGWQPLSVGESVEATRAQRELVDTQPDMPPWSRSWLALCFDGSRGSLACETDVASGAPSPVHMYFADDESRDRPAVPSIGELVHFWIDAIRDGTLSVDSDGAFVLLSPAEMEQARGPLAELL
jgi:hypothetical protein